jgi:sugar phosphate isomerase/epimerase
MFISLNGTIVTGRVDWPEFATLAAKAGFGGVDPVLDKAMRAGALETRKLFSGLRIQPAALNLPVEFRKDDAAFDESFRQLEEAVRFATAIGCPRFVTWIPSSSDLPKAQQRAVYLKRFRACADVMARSHVRLGLEFLGPLHIRKSRPQEFIWRMNEMLAFARECGPNVGLLLDSWHWHHAGATTADILKAGKDAIVHVHLNDAAALPPEDVRDNERLMPGEGVIDLMGFFHALKQIGYSDAVSVEVFGRGLKEMAPEEAAILARKSAESVMKRAGVL